MQLKRAGLRGFLVFLLLTAETLSSAIASDLGIIKLGTELNGVDVGVNAPLEERRMIYGSGAVRVGSDDGSPQRYEDLKRLLDDPADTEDVKLGYPFMRWEFPDVPKRPSDAAANEFSADTGINSLAEVLQSIVNASPSQPTSGLLTRTDNERSGLYGSSVNVQHFPSREQSRSLNNEELSGSATTLSRPYKDSSSSWKRNGYGNFKSTPNECDPCVQLSDYQQDTGSGLLVTTPSPRRNGKAGEIELPGGLGTITEGEVDEFVDSLLMKAQLNKEQREQREQRASQPLPRDVICSPCKEANDDPSALTGTTKKYFEVGGDRRPLLQEHATPQVVLDSANAPRAKKNGLTGPRSSFYYQLAGSAIDGGTGTGAQKVSPTGETKASTTPLLYHVNELKSGKPTVISLDPSTAENFLRAINTRGPALQVVEIPYEETEDEEDEEHNDKDSREQKPKTLLARTNFTTVSI